MVTKQKQQLLDALNEYRSLGITKQIDYTQSAGPIKPLFGPTNRFSFPITERFHLALQKGNSLNHAGYGGLHGVSKATVKCYLSELKASSFFTRVGSDKNGL